MKPFTVISAILVSLCLLTILGWAAGLLYWHFKIGAAVRDFKEDVLGPPPDQPDSQAGHRIFESGCRSLPYLVNALEESQPAALQEALTHQLLANLTRGASGRGIAPDVFWRYHKEWMISSDDPADVRGQKCRKVREWWRREGAHYHQGWRFWSEWCPEK